MKTRIPCLLAALTLLAASSLVHSATITWTNTSGGNWSATNNWSPHRLPATNDVVLITTPGTYTVTLDFTPNYTVFYPDVTLGAGGGAAGVQTLAMTNVAFYFTNLLVTTGGVVTAVSANIGSLDGERLTVNGGVLNSVSGSVCGFGSSLLVTNGGAVTCTGGNIYQVTVASGGVFKANGGTLSLATIANGGRCIANGLSTGNFHTLTVAHGGVLDITNGLSVFGPLINSGTINLTNSYIYIYVMASAYNGGLYNQPGGVINVAGGTSIGQNSGDFINRGALIESAGPGCTVNVGNFDNTQGTVTNLAGTMVLGTIQTNLAGTYFAAAGTTNKLVGANNATPLTPGSPLVLGGSGQYQLTSGYLRLPTNTFPNLTLIGTRLELGPGFQGGAITNLTLNGITLSNTLPVTGKFTVTNSAIQGSFTVASGGVFTATNTATYGAVTVANGGRFTANGVVYIAGSLTLAHNGVFNIAGALSLFGPLTNSGIINLTNAPVLISGAGIINQPGGLIDFWGNGANILANYASDYFVNKGMVAQSVGATTNRINVFGFDTSQGTVTNLAGTLVLGTFYTNLTGTFSTAAGATIQFVGGTSGTPLTAGTPLVLAGSGQNLFTSGYLSLPTNVIPGLGLRGGTLQLGAGFQGGAITNLTLGGMTLTNTLPVTGTFTTTKSLVFGNLAVASGGVLNTDGGMFNGALTIASGGRLDITNNVRTAGPITNSGTIRIFDDSLLLPDNNGSNTFGALVNQSGGLVDFAGDYAGLLSWVVSGARDYLINKGQMIKSVGTGLGGIGLAFGTNSGTIAVLSGTMQMSPMTLQPASSLSVRLNSATDYGRFMVGSPTLGGSFSVSLNGGYVPTNGSSFTVFSYASFSGAFTSLSLPPVVSWQPNFGSTNFTLLVGGVGRPQFGTLYLSATNLIFSGTGGTPGGNYVVLASTNVALPLTNWTAVATNKFDSSGHFNFTNGVNSNTPRQFFILKSP